MKEYKQVEIPARMSKQIARVRCDLCARDAEQPGNPWTKGSYDVAEVEVSYKEGDSYPEGGSGTTIKFDICPSCFKEILIPLLESKGATPRKEEWDY